MPGLYPIVVTLRVGRKMEVEWPGQGNRMCANLRDHLQERLQRVTRGVQIVMDLTGIQGDIQEDNTWRLMVLIPKEVNRHHVLQVLSDLKRWPEQDEPHVIIRVAVRPYQVSQGI